MADKKKSMSMNTLLMIFGAAFVGIMIITFVAINFMKKDRPAPQRHREQPVAAAPQQAAMTSQPALPGPSYAPPADSQELRAAQDKLQQLAEQQQGQQAAWQQQGDLVITRIKSLEARIEALEAKGRRVEVLRPKSSRGVSAGTPVAAPAHAEAVVGDLYWQDGLPRRVGQ